MEENLRSSGALGRVQTKNLVDEVAHFVRKRLVLGRARGKSSLGNIPQYVLFVFADKREGRTQHDVNDNAH